jgi:hypothetical protein
MLRGRHFNDSVSTTQVMQRRIKGNTDHKSVRRDVKECGSDRQPPGETKEHYGKLKYKTALGRDSDID